LLPLEAGTTMDDLAEGAMRLTVKIDRTDMSRTESQLFRVAEAESEMPPSHAWISVGY